MTRVHARNTKYLSNQIPEDMSYYSVTHVEFWSIQQAVQETKVTQSFSISSFFQTSPVQNNPMSLFRNNPVIMLPRAMPLGQVSLAVLKNKHKFYHKQQEIEASKTLDELFTSNKKEEILDLFFDSQSHEFQEMREE